MKRRGPERRAARLLPGDVCARHFSFAGQRFAVLSFPVDAAPAPDSLSPAERDVLRLVLHGMRSAEIASHRGTSVRTVTNQIASLLRKLGVTSRGELLARLARG